MLRFGLGLAIALGALSGVASAQTAETAVAASQSKPEKTQRSRGRDRPVVTAQPLMVPPLPERKTAKASPIPPPPETWTAAEIDAAKARCTAALKGLDADVTAEAPIKEGLCGTPAPIRLSRLGGVTFTPAALINCGMLVAAQHLDQQGAAAVGAAPARRQDHQDRGDERLLLPHRVRPRRSQAEPSTPTSTRSTSAASSPPRSEEVVVLERLGRHQPRHRRCGGGRQGQGRAARRRAGQAANAQRDNLRDGKSGAGETPAPTPTASALGTPGSGAVKATRSGGIDKVTVILSGSGKKPAAARLGGPDDQLLAEVDKRSKEPLTASLPTAVSPDLLAAPPTGPRARFLREAHAAACRIFGTTLGPEANEAHRNHFHVDMAERKVKKICD